METESYWRNEHKKLQEEMRQVYQQVNYYVNENTKLREENVALREKLGINAQSV
jgi:regulator of replication initiation timing